MRKFRLGLLAAVLLATQPAHSQETELRFTTQDFAPFNYLADGAVAGPAHEIIMEACKKIRSDCTFELLPWTRAQQEVREGKANGMFVIGWNKPRSEWVHFSPPLMKTEYGFFVQSDDDLEYQKPADLQGRLVAVYGPSNTSRTLSNFREDMISKGLEPIEIDMRPDDESGFRKLAAGRVDAVFSNRDVGLSLATGLGLRDRIRYAGKSRDLNYYVGFGEAHNDPKVLSAFNSAVKELLQDGTVEKILGKYEMLMPEKRLDVADTM